MLSPVRYFKDDLLQASLFESNPLPLVIVHGSSLKIVAANPAAQQFLHYNATEITTLNFLDLFDLSTKFEVHKLLQNAGLKAPVRGNYLQRKKNGQLASAEVLISKMVFEGDAFYQVIYIETNKKQIEERIDLLSNLADQTSDILTAADLDFKHITWSKSAEKIYGLKAHQVLGHNISDIINISYQNATLPQVRAIIKSKGEWRGEMFFTRPTDGKNITLLLSFKLLKDEQGQPLGYVIAATDITERKENESKLRESENRFREMADSAPVGIWMSNTENKVIYVNKVMVDVTGLATERFNNLSWASLVHPEDAQKTVIVFNEHFNKRLPITLIYRIKVIAGDYRWVQDTGIPRLLPDGTFLGYIGSLIDIHDTKEQVRQLHYQATILENVQDCIITAGIDFKVQTCNAVAEKTFGCTKAAIGKPLFEIICHQLFNNPIPNAVNELQQNGIWKGEVEYENESGDKKFFLFTVTYVTNEAKERVGILAVGRDISERKSAEAKLLESEQFYRNLIADSLDATLLTNASGIITFVSPAIKNVMGYEIGEVLGKNAFSFIHADDQPSAWEAFQQEVAEVAVIKSIVVRVRKRSGEWLWCLARCHNMLQNKHVGSIVIYIHDDTERKQASIALKQSEQRFRTLIRDVKLGVVLADAEGKLQVYNNTMAELLDANDTELNGHNLFELFKNPICEDETVFTSDNFPPNLVIATKKPVKDVIIGITKTNTHDRVWLLINANPVLDDEGRILHVISSFTDITERKKLVEKMMLDQLKQQKLLTQATIDGQEKERKEIGKELHDNIGQQLTTTKLYLDLAKNTADDTTLEMLNLSIRSVADVINDLRTMSHSLVPPTLGDLGLVDSVYELIEAIRVAQLLQIKFDHDAFDEENLAENQKLMLFRIIQEQSSNILKHSGASEVQITLKNNKKFLLLQVKDDGKGFSLEERRKGLGLTNIKNRADLFGGKVTIITSPGNGCTLKVTIPTP